MRKGIPVCGFLGKSRGCQRNGETRRKPCVAVNGDVSPSSETRYDDLETYTVKLDVRFVS